MQMNFLKHTVGDATFLLKKWDQVTKHIDKFGLFEPDTLGYVEKNIKPKTRFIDGGSYNGIYSFVAHAKGALPFAFEPNPENFDRIWENMKHNKRFFDVLRVALSDECKAAPFYYNASTIATSAGSLQPSPKKKSFRTVQCERLDNYNLVDVGMIKLDIERHEPFALKGAERTILRERPIIIVELLDTESRHKVDAILHFLDYKDGPLLDKVNQVYLPK